MRKGRRRAQRVDRGLCRALVRRRFPVGPHPEAHLPPALRRHARRSHALAGRRGQHRRALEQNFLAPAVSAPLGRHLRLLSAGRARPPSPHLL